MPTENFPAGTAGVAEIVAPELVELSDGDEFELRIAPVTKELEGDTARQPDVSYLVGKVRDTLNSFVYERTRRRPMILPLVTEV